jgi:tetratricopeptide (TPR) repeat protein
MADLSPELAAKIQSLEGGYADNPGRYFVALAGAWREAGEIGRAEEILRENLKRFPGLSAHVLLGRCLADRGAHQEAANEFHYVLSIDAQNLIALRTLAEMAAANGRRGEAERWYNELLAVDPMNAEARAALAQLSRGGADASVLDQPVQVGTGWGGASEPAPVAGGADAGGAEPEDREFGMIDLSAPDASAADASGVAADDDTEGEWGDLPLDMANEPEPAAASAPAGDFDAFGFGSVELDAAGNDAADPWVDADARQDLGESAAADQAGADLPFLDADATVPADLPLLDADATIPADLPLLDVDAPSGGLADFTAAASGAPAGLPPFHHGDDHVDHQDHDVDGEVVTETMAELYAAQGLLQQSADTYRELIRQRGEEPGLVRRLAEIEARLQSAAAEAPAAEPAGEEAPDWLASVDAFAMGGAAGAMAAIHMSAEPEPGPELVDTPADLSAETPETFVDTSTDIFAKTFAEVPADTFAETPGAERWETAAPSAGTSDDTVVPAGVGAGAVTGDVDADAFADSFAGGFDGVDAGTPEPAFAAAPVASADAEPSGDREPWEAPAVRETEPVGFDLIVVEEDGDTVAAPPEVVADVSADWAIAAAPLEDDEEAAEAEASTFAAPVAAGVSTMRAYFTGLLAWQPGHAAAVETPAVLPTPAYDEPAVERSAIEEIAGEIPPLPVAPEAEEEPWAEPPAPPVAEAADEPWNEVPPPPVAEAADEPWSEAPAEPVAETPQEPWGEPATALPDAAGEPWNEAPAAPVDEAPAYDLPAAGAAEPADEPWGAPAEDAAEAGDDDLPLMDLGDEPWAAPRAPEPASIDSFTLADDAAAEPEVEAMPWELPSEPAQPVAEAAPAADAGGGFSFEDFFAGGGPSAAAETPVTPEPEPEPVREPEAPAAFVPSLAFEPAPPPPPVASAPPAAPAASPAAAGQDEEDEDLESFQAWLQSLKR